MLQYGNLLNFQLMIFMLTAAGFMLRKLSIITPQTRKGLTDFVILFVLPCNIINSFLIEMSMEVLLACVVVLAVSIAIQIVCDISGRVIYRKAPPEQQQVLRYGTLCPNSAFLGTPLVEGIYGMEGVVLASIYLIPQRIVMWSAGVAIFSGSKDKNAIKKVLTHPCVICAGVGLIIMIFQIPMPEFFSKTVSTVSSSTVSLSMIVVGGILAEIDIRTVVSRRTLYFSLIRLIILPGVVLVACKLLGLSPLVASVSVILTAMPAGTTTAILAEKYGCDSGFAVKCVFLSTLLSLLSIPLWCILADLVL